MSAIKECYQLTKKLYDLVKSEGERESKIDHLTSLLDERESILTAIQPPFTGDEKKLGQQIVLMNKVIESEMQSVKTAIDRDRNGLNKKKTSVQKYVNPYESLQYDGMFYDKKK
ncbi:flagellar protein FliT [Bacillus sp. 2205SS5-2]|uniref:flagellar protein FliT n=1 Tax=Bacillus sp. 2205SS5-2 TaxID=3109031 RepID=UPI003007B700